MPTFKPGGKRPSTSEGCRRQPPPALAIAEQGQVLGVRIGVADQHVEHHPVQQPLHRRGAEGEPAHQRRTRGQARPAAGLVLESIRIAQRLAEILLVQALQRAVGCANAVVAFDQQRRPAQHVHQSPGGRIQVISPADLAGE